MPDAFPSFRLDGQVALVTASSKGIGRACALALAHSGADVVLGLHDVTAGGDLVGEIERLGRRALAVQMDMTRLDEIRGAVAEALAHFGQIDILVNNAGVGAPNPAEDVTEADFDATLAVNLKGTFFTAQAIGRHMLERGWGTIINVGSQAGAVALPTESVYCMTKAGVSHLTRCLALEWGPRGVRVNAVAPTFVETPGTRRWLDDPAFRASVVARIPLGRIGQPVDVAGAVVFLASPAAALITGETLMVDGGWTLP